MSFGAQYGLFVLEVITVLVLLGVGLTVIVGGIVRASSRGGGRPEGSLEVKKLNRTVERLADAIAEQSLPKARLKARQKARRRAKKAAAKGREATRRRLFVLEFDGDLKASAVANLRKEITAVVSAAQEGDRVLVRVDSGGGLVHAYGLAASQLERLKEAGLELTVAVDKVAASGGYMMAAVADHLVAAPFAILGSIGVVATVPNLHRFLQDKKVDVELHTAGEFKRTLTVLGENTEEGRKKFLEQLEDTHGLFKTWIAKHRPQLDLSKVATGEYWFGTQALELGLVDAIGTSDDLVLAALEESDVLSVRYKQRRSLGARLSGFVDATAKKLVGSVAQADADSRYL